MSQMARLVPYLRMFGDVWPVAVTGGRPTTGLGNRGQAHVAEVYDVADGTACSVLRVFGDALPVEVAGGRPKTGSGNRAWPAKRQDRSSSLAAFCAGLSERRRRAGGRKRTYVVQTRHRLAVQFVDAHHGCGRPEFVGKLHDLQPTIDGNSGSCAKSWPGHASGHVSSRVLATHGYHDGLCEGRGRRGTTGRDPTVITIRRWSWGSIGVLDHSNHGENVSGPCSFIGPTVGVTTASVVTSKTLPTSSGRTFRPTGCGVHRGQPVTCRPVTEGSPGGSEGSEEQRQRADSESASKRGSRTSRACRPVMEGPGKTGGRRSACRPVMEGLDQSERRSACRPVMKGLAQSHSARACRATPSRLTLGAVTVQLNASSATPVVVTRMRVQRRIVICAQSLDRVVVVQHVRCFGRTPVRPATHGRRRCRHGGLPAPRAGCRFRRRDGMRGSRCNDAEARMAPSRRYAGVLRRRLQRSEMLDVPSGSPSLTGWASITRWSSWMRSCER
jgi:hypothetical protein